MALAPHRLGGAFLLEELCLARTSAIAICVQTPGRQGPGRGAETRALRPGLSPGEEGGLCVGALLTALQTCTCAPTPTHMCAHVPTRPTPSVRCRHFLFPISHLESRSVFDGPFALF